MHFCDKNPCTRVSDFPLDEIRRATVYGIRPTRTFQQGAIKYLHDYQLKKSLERDVYAFNRILPHIGDLSLERIHNDTLAQYRQVARTGSLPAPSTRSCPASGGS